MIKALMFPGQGSQYRGMGKDLFPKYKAITDKSSNLLGYDLEELCLRDPNRLLGKTEYTQPALFVLNALRYYDGVRRGDVDFVVGHSLGEYNALHAAGVIDFETGLKMVMKRGALMGAASGGGMAAVLGVEQDKLMVLLQQGGHEGVDVANYNTPTQFVISGQKEEIDRAFTDLDQQGVKVVPLFVTAPFHSRYMKAAADEFKTFLQQFTFNMADVPVIANTTALPYVWGNEVATLSTQIDHAVLWVDSIRYLMGQGVEQFDELGTDILTKMVTEIKDKCSPIMVV